MGEVGSLACVGFMVEGTDACVLVGGARSCLSGGQGCSPVVCFGVSVNLV